MGLLDFFIKRKLKRAKRRKSKNSSAYGKQQIVAFQCQLDAINNTLQDHRKDIDENSAILKEHGLKLKNLENILTNHPMGLPPSQTSPTQQPDWATKPVQSNGTNGCKFDINQFSQQEKKILAVFFQNKDIALSYADIAKTLGKSPNTIKNEIRQITFKANLFDYTIGDENRKRFKLKDNLRIENYLNIAA
jgi:hypothetical protein